MAGNISQEDETFRMLQAPGCWHIVCLRFLIEVILGQVSHVTLPIIIGLLGNTEIALLQHKLYNTNSDTSSVVVIHCWLVSLPYFYTFYFAWRHRWRHRDSFGISAFFDNSFLSNWVRESRKVPLCLHWTPESINMRLDPYLNPWLQGVWPDLALGVNLDFDLHRTKSI